MTDDSVLLSWIPGSDDHTSPNSLTYDLKLFKDNLPVSFPGRNPEPGNVSNVSTWLFNGLESGNYTWIVSTVGASFMGSPLATGQFSLFPVSRQDDPINGAEGPLIIQNHPNPFSETTTINYTLPEAGYATLKVYSPQGMEIKTLVDGLQDAGTHSIQFHAAGLPEGFYFYRLITGSFSQTKRMVIQR